ncbi:hypothetical protein ABTZ03_30940 [Kitasatospora sp. NPDC096077]|uniref:hypothetical protein n=1 Tax=Kitasatospora sp. NPDC096077 TaxID=3155544 RepID=UPI00332F2923
MHLLRRSPAPPAPALPAEPDPDHWTPAGVTVRIRYANLAGARVLLYTRDLADRQDSSTHGVHCLGCTGTWTMTDSKPSRSTPYPLDYWDGQEKANEHAGRCRALPGPIPGRPGDETAAGILTTRIARAQHGQGFNLHIGDFTGDRVLLQRTDAWIYRQLATIADRRPDLLAVITDTTSTGTTHVYHRVQPHPSTRTQTTTTR